MRTSQELSKPSPVMLIEGLISAAKPGKTCHHQTGMPREMGHAEKFVPNINVHCGWKVSHSLLRVERRDRKPLRGVSISAHLAYQGRVYIHGRAVRKLMPHARHKTVTFSMRRAYEVIRSVPQQTTSFTVFLQSLPRILVAHSRCTSHSFLPLSCSLVLSARSSG